MKILLKILGKNEITLELDYLLFYFCYCFFEKRPGTNKPLGAFFQIWGSLID